MQELIKAQYEKHVIKTDDGCWSWGYAVHDSGYGVFGNSGGISKMVYAHRASYEIHVGKIPSGMDVMHLCHNPLCSNPSHLSLGTRKENMQTSFVAGRLQRKIPLDSMPEIYQRRAAGQTLQSIANKYNCTKQAIRHMLNAHPELCHA